MHLTVRIIGARPGGKQEEDIRRSVTLPKTMRPKKNKNKTLLNIDLVAGAHNS